MSLFTELGQQKSCFSVEIMRKALIGGAVIVMFLGAPVAVKLLQGKSARAADFAYVEVKEIRPLVLASGILAFRQEVQLSSELIAKVTAVLVKEGEVVRRGQVLLQLDPATYRAEVAQQEANARNVGVAIERAKLNIANQQRLVDRKKQLVAAKYIDVSSFDEAQHQLELSKIELRSAVESLEQSKAQLSQATDRLAKTVLRAPIDGLATTVQIKVGETAIASVTGIPGSALMTIADVDGLLVEVNVDEADIGRVMVGQQVRVYPSAFADIPLAGKVESVSMAPKVNPQGRSYMVKTRLANTDLAVRTGMTCRVEISVGAGSPRTAIPLQALLFDEQADGKPSKKAYYVLVVENGLVKRSVVEIGPSDDINQEVTAGLKVGQKIVVGPQRLLRELRDGDAVKSTTAQAVATLDKGVAR